LVIIAVAPVAADNTAPRSLHMRAQQSAGSAWSPMRWVQRIAQVTPAGAQPASTPDPTSGIDPAAPGGDPPVQGPPAAPAAPARTPGGLSDEERARLEQEAKTRAIPVTGTLIHREEVGSPSLVSVVDREMLVDAGITNVGDVLQKLPAQGNATN